MPEFLSVKLEVMLNKRLSIEKKQWAHTGMKQSQTPQIIEGLYLYKEKKRIAAPSIPRPIPSTSRPRSRLEMILPFGGRTSNKPGKPY